MSDETGNELPPGVTEPLGGEPAKQSSFLLYGSDDQKVHVRVLLQDETIWLSLSQMAELFDVHVPAISKHLKNIYDTGELDRPATVSKMEIVQSKGDRQAFARDYFREFKKREMPRASKLHADVAGKLALERYETFDAARREVARLAADAEDMAILERTERAFEGNQRRQKT